MSPKELARIIAEGLQASVDEREISCYLDVEDLDSAVLDGRVNLIKLAEFVLKRMKE